MFYDYNNLNFKIITAILIVLLIYSSLGLALYLISFLYNRNCVSNKNVEKNVEENVPGKQRILAVDTFRGLCMVITIFVRYGGKEYNFFKHSIWNGLKFSDLIFAWFLWIMGVCIPISVKSALKRDNNKFNIFLNILKRSVILFMLGLCLNSVQEMETLRIFGVLQRFGVCYFFNASLHLICSNIQMPGINNLKHGKDILMLLPQWIVIITIVLFHTLCIFFVEIPGEPNCTGYLGPGGDHESGRFINCTGGLSNYIDKQILGEKHLSPINTIAKIYTDYSIPFDPEGIFSTLPALFQVFLGVQAGTTMQVHQKHIPRIRNWLIWSVVTGLIGGAFCGFSKEDGIIPLNKNLWSLSFVLVTTCFAFHLLTIFYVVLDMKKFWSGKPLLFAGMNSTILYVGHAISYNRFPFQWGMLEPNLHFQSLSQAAWGLCIWVLVSYWLYKIEFFLSV